MSLEQPWPRSSFQAPRDFLVEAGLVPLCGWPPSSEVRPGVGGAGGPGEASVGRWEGGTSGQTWCRYEDVFVGLVALPQSTVSGAFSVTAGRWGLDPWPLVAMALSQL